MRKPAAVPLVYIPIQSVIIRLSRLTETYTVTGHTNYADVRLAQTSYFDLNDSGAKAIHTDAASVLEPERVILPSDPSDSGECMSKGDR